MGPYFCSVALRGHPLRASCWKLNYLPQRALGHQVVAQGTAGGGEQGDGEPVEAGPAGGQAEGVPHHGQPGEEEQRRAVPAHPFQLCQRLLRTGVAADEIGSKAAGGIAQRGHAESRPEQAGVEPEHGE